MGVESVFDACFPSCMIDTAIGRRRKDGGDGDGEGVASG